MRKAMDQPGLGIGRKDDKQLTDLRHCRRYCTDCRTSPCITGSAVALHCCKARAKINRKMGNLTPCKIVTPKNLILKLCTRHYVGESTPHANFGFNRYSGCFSPNRRNITTLRLFLTVLTFFSRSYAQVEPLDRFSRFMAQTTCFRARMVLLKVRTMGDHIWGNILPKTPQNGRE